MKKTKSLYGDTLELILKNRVGTHCFPTSDYKFLPKEYKGQTIGISRFALIDKKLVEFSIIVNIKESLDEDKSIKYAQNIMDSFWLGIETIEKLKNE